MKILYIVGSLGAGGIERYISGILPELKKQVWISEIQVFCTIINSGIFAKKLHDNGIKTHGANQKVSFNNSVDLLKDTLINFKPDIIHSMVNFSVWNQTRIFKRYSNARIFFTERSMPPVNGMRRFRKVIQYYMIKPFIEKYTANGLGVQLYMSKIFKEKLKNILVTPNFVALNIKKTAPNNKKLQVVYVSRFALTKGQDLFLHAISKLPKNILNDCNIKFYGIGPNLKFCKSLASDLKINRYVEFCGVSEDIPFILRKSHVGILASQYEGSSNTILEYMNSGLAILTSNVGEVPHALDLNSACIIDDLNSIREISVKFQLLIENRDLRERLGQNAFKKSLNYSRKVSIDSLMSLYNKNYSIS